MNPNISNVSDSPAGASAGGAELDRAAGAEAFTVPSDVSAETDAAATRTLHAGAVSAAENGSRGANANPPNGPDGQGAPAPAAPPRKASAWNSPWFFVALLALALAAWQWMETRVQLADTRQELAKRLGEGDLARRNSELEAKKAQEEVAVLKTKFAVIEEKFAESKNQQATLELLYQQLLKGREEWAFAEIEQGLNLAAQQLQLAGNVQAAVLALQTADARLANNKQPQFIALRKAVDRDLGRLQALPAIDLPGLSMRLERILGDADTLPLAVYARPHEAPASSSSTSPAKAANAPARRGGAAGNAGEAARAASGKAPAAAVEAEPAGFWKRFGGELWSELKGMVRIQRFDREEPPLLAPGQEFFLRENLKLRLLNARLALLMRDRNTYRGEIAAAQNWIRRYFDTREASVQAALTSLQQLGAAEIDIALPTLNDSLSALRNARLVEARQ